MVTCIHIVDLHAFSSEVATTVDTPRLIRG